jgi:ribosomal protein S19E (S16A)
LAAKIGRARKGGEMNRAAVPISGFSHRSKPAVQERRERAKTRGQKIGNILQTLNDLGLIRKTEQGRYLKY